MPVHLLASTQAGIWTPTWLKTSGVRIALIVALALAVSRIGTVSIRRMRKKLDGTPNATGALNLRRSTTVVGIVSSALRVVIWTVVGLLVLGEFGVDLGPLIAGAGIVGVALGFGAQSLVKDFLSGFFILLENQFTVGDMVEIDTDISSVKAMGRVEALTLRTTAVRCDDGTLAVVPNGNIHVVSNRSRGQTRVTVEVNLPRGEDLEEIRAILTALCDELRTDERISPRLFSGPDVLGIQRLTGDSVLLRVAAETTPARAEEIRNEVGRRIEQRFVAVPHQIDVVGS